MKLPHGCIPIRCKWVFKTKFDSKGKVERYKVRLVAKVSAKRKGLITMRLSHPFLLRIVLDYHGDGGLF